MMHSTHLLGIGQPPPPPPPPPLPPFPPPWAWGPPPVQTVYIREHRAEEVGSPCEWYEDPVTVGEDIHCRAPAIWLVIAAVGTGTLFMMARKR